MIVSSLLYTIKSTVPANLNSSLNIICSGTTSRDKEPSKNEEKKPGKVNTSDKKPYLDIYILQRLRFSIIDLNGMVTDIHINRLQEELDTVLKSNIKIIAIRMSNVKAINETGLATVLSFQKDFSKRGRYTAILDPSKEIETFINELTTEGQRDNFLKLRNIDLSYSIPGRAHFRTNIFKQSKGFGIAMRFVPEKIPTMEELGLPPVFRIFPSASTTVKPKR